MIDIFPEKFIFCYQLTKDVAGRRLADWGTPVLATTQLSEDLISTPSYIHEPFKYL